jgi:hypothetical protein
VKASPVPDASDVNFTRRYRPEEVSFDPPEQNFQRLFEDSEEPSNTSTESQVHPRQVSMFSYLIVSLTTLFAGTWIHQKCTLLFG